MRSAVRTLSSEVSAAAPSFLTSLHFCFKTVIAKKNCVNRRAESIHSWCRPRREGLMRLTIFWALIHPTKYVVKGPCDRFMILFICKDLCNKFVLHVLVIQFVW